MSRRSVLVVAVIAVVAVLLAVVGRDRPSSPSTTDAELVPGLMAALNDVEQVTITTAGPETVATLDREADGWAVAEKDDYPADIAKLRQALLALAQARIVEEKTADPKFYSRLGVDSMSSDTAAGVAVAIDPGTGRFPTVILGEASGTSGRFVRRADEARSYLIDKNPDIPQTAAQWVVPDIIDVRGARVERVTIEHADGERVEIWKTDPDQSNFTVESVPEGRELSYPGVANVIGNALRELKLEDVARTDAAGNAGATPDAVTEFRTFDGLVVTVTGTKRGDEGWITLVASAEPGGAGSAEADDEAATVPEAGDASADDASATTEAGDARPAADPAGEAAAINARVGGWRYRIAAHQYDQITRRLSDLLKAEG